MNDKYIVYKIEAMVNKLLYNKKIIDKDLHDKVANKIDKILFEENKNNIFRH